MLTLNSVFPSALIIVITANTGMHINDTAVKLHPIACAQSG